MVPIFFLQIYLNKSTKRAGGLSWIISLLASSAENLGVDPGEGQTKEYYIDNPR